MPDRSDSEYLAYVHGRIPALRPVTYLLSGDEHEVDDLVPETLTKLYARWPRISGVENVDGYVHTMLVRTFLGDRRRGWWKVKLFGRAAEPPPVAEGSPEDRRGDPGEQLQRRRPGGRRLHGTSEASTDRPTGS